MNIARVIAVMIVDGRVVSKLVRSFHGVLGGGEIRWFNNVTRHGLVFGVECRVGIHVVVVSCEADGQRLTVPRTVEEKMWYGDRVSRCKGGKRKTKKMLDEVKIEQCIVGLDKFRRAKLSHHSSMAIQKLDRTAQRNKSTGTSQVHSTHRRTNEETMQHKIKTKDQQHHSRALHPFSNWTAPYLLLIWSITNRNYVRK